jgi:hypothetical protein
MINRTRCLFYEVKGVFYKDLAEAQKADLKALMPSDWQTPHENVLDWMMANAEPIATILTTTPKSRIRKPRKDKGVPRKARSAKPEPSATP